MLADLHDGGHVPAAAVPRARRAEPARARRQLGLVVVPALPAPHQPVRAAHRLRRPPRVPGGGVPRPTASSSGSRCTSTATSSRSWCSSGGFSAATAMIVVDSLALSKMITNDVILPVLLRRRYTEDIYWITLLLHAPRPCSAWSRSDCCGRAWRAASSCSSRWGCCPSSPSRSARRPSCSGSTGAGATARARSTGISAGFAIWFYTLILPALVREGVLAARAPAGRAARDRLPSADGVPRPGRARHPQPRGLLVALPERRRLSSWSRC